MADRVLVASDLRRRFGDVEAVRGVSFHIDAGETYGLLGPNGAGKTTAISMVAGLLTRDGGEVTVDGMAMNPKAVAPRAAVGLVPQDLAIYPDLTATENLEFFGRLYGMGGKPLATRVAEVLELIGLSDRARDRSKEFSGGMKRRLNIGIGLLHQPKLLILDEPTVGVDPQSRHAIIESIEQLSRQGMAVLYTTHYMEEAERLCDRVGIIDQGQIKAEGTQRELVQMVGQKDKVTIDGTGPLAAVRDRLAAELGVFEASIESERIELLVKDAAGALPRLLTTASEAGMSITGVSVAEPNLEAVFLHLTGKALRD